MDAESATPLRAMLLTPRLVCTPRCGPGLSRSAVAAAPRSVRTVRVRPASCAGSDKGGASEWSSLSSDPAAGESEELVRADSAGTHLGKGKRRIMVALDRGDASHRALDWALSTLARKGDELHLVNVVPLDRTYAPISISPGAMAEVLPQVDPDLRAAAERQSMALLDEQAARVKRHAGVACVSHVVVEHTWESVSHAICAKAAELDAQLLVVASSGKNWVRAPPMCTLAPGPHGQRLPCIPGLRMGR